MNNLKKVLQSTAISFVVAATAQAETFNMIVQHSKDNQVLSMSSDKASIKTAMTEQLKAIAAPYKILSQDVMKKNAYSEIKVEAKSLEAATLILKNTGQFSDVREMPMVTNGPGNQQVWVNSQNSLATLPTDTPNDEYIVEQLPYLDGFLSSVGYDGVINHQGHNFVSVWRNAPLQTVRVGIVDGGFAPHDDIPYTDDAANFTSEYNNNPYEEEEFFVERMCNEHGTAVSSITASIHNNEIGVVGAAKNVEIVPVKALECGIGGSTFVKAVQWLAGKSYLDDGVEDISEPVSVINLSLGGKVKGGCMPFIQEGIDYALERGIPVVVAAGNDTINTNEFFPAGCEGVTTVAATDKTNDMSDFTNYGTNVALGAQGTDILAAVNPYGSEGMRSVGWWSGTSMSAPIVTAAYASVFEQVDAELTSAELKYLLVSTTNAYSENSVCTTFTGNEEEALEGNTFDGNGCGAGSLNTGAFLDATRLYVEGKLSFIKHALADETPCDAKMLIDELSDLETPICKLFDVSFNKLAKEKHNITYTGYRIAKGEVLEVETAEIFAPTSTSPFFRTAFTTEELDGYDYGFVTCQDGECGDMLNLTVDSARSTECPE